MYQKVLVPLDGSELAESVLPHVENIAKTCGAKSITFLRVVEPVIIATGYEDAFNAKLMQQMEDADITDAQKYLNQMEGRFKYEGVDIQTKMLTGGKAADMIADYATKNNVDLIVIATHGRSGPSRWVMGSVADRIVRTACVAVLMVRPPSCVPIGI